MSDEKRRILEMVADGAITQEEAVRLLEALGEQPGEETAPEAEDAPVTEAKPEGPHLTLFPEETELDRLDEAISETVEKVIGQAIGSVEAFTEKMDGFGQQLDQAVNRAADQAVQAGQSAINTLGEVLADHLPSEDAPGAFLQPYPGSYPAEDLTSLTVHWAAGPVEILRGEGETLQITEFAKRPLEPEERMTVSVNNGRVEIHWTEKQQRSWLGKLKTVGLSKRLLVELPASVERLDALKVHTASGPVKLSDLPAAKKFTVETASGGVSLENVSGEEMSIHTASGVIRAQSVTGDDLGFETASGAVRLTDVSADEITAYTASGSLAADRVRADELSLHTVSGSLTAESARAEELDLKTVSGRLNASAVNGQEVDASTVSGALSLSMDALPRDLNAGSISGGITLVLPDQPEPGFTAQYNTHSGSFHSDFPLEGLTRGKSGKGSYGAGETRIHFSTTSGAIRIRKSQ